MAESPNTLRQGENQRDITFNNSKRAKVYVFILIALILIGIISWFYLKVFFRPQTPKFSDPRDEPIVREDVKGDVLPADFPQDIPLLPEAKVIETYDLVFSESKKPSQAVVVFETNKNPIEVKQYYLPLLQKPKFIQQTEAGEDSENIKSLVYSFGDRIVVVWIEKIEAGSKVTLRYINPFGNLR